MDEARLLASVGAMINVLKHFALTGSVQGIGPAVTVAEEHYLAAIAQPLAEGEPMPGVAQGMVDPGVEDTTNQNATPQETY